jgi:hypothetical protein
MQILMVPYVSYVQPHRTVDKEREEERERESRMTGTVRTVRLPVFTVGLGLGEEATAGKRTRKRESGPTHTHTHTHTPLPNNTRGYKTCTSQPDKHGPGNCKGPAQKLPKVGQNGLPKKGARDCTSKAKFLWTRNRKVLLPKKQGTQLKLIRAARKVLVPKNKKFLCQRKDKSCCQRITTTKDKQYGNAKKVLVPKNKKFLFPSRQKVWATKNILFQTPLHAPRNYQRKGSHPPSNLQFSMGGQAMGHDWNPVTLHVRVVATISPS